MSKAGQNNYKGINTQAWAAMSLFLQFLRDPNFSHIHLEAVGFEDFNLVFNNGKKIICESKDRKKAFSYADLKEILTKIIKNKGITNGDEILIICTNINKEFISRVDSARYWEPLQKELAKKGYTEEMIALLPKVKFWHIKSKFTQKTIYALVADLLNFWLPIEDVTKIADSMLVQRIYLNSANGGIYSRLDILNEINALASGVQQNSVYYKEQLSKREEQFWELEQALENSGHAIWKVPKELSAFSADFERLKFASDRLTVKKNQLNLKQWDPLWRLNRVPIFNFGIFRIFENNLHTEENKKYILNYIKKYSRSIKNFYRFNFFDVEVVKITTKIIQDSSNGNYIDDAFEIVKDLISFSEQDFFYLKDPNYDSGKWEREEMCNLLVKIYDLGDTDLRTKVFDLLIKNFNLTDNDGEFDWYTPRQVYNIINRWLEEDFKTRFNKLIDILVGQYEGSSRKLSRRNEFNGWEYSGGGISFSGNYMGSHYRISERHFVIAILMPAIEKFYNTNPVSSWDFIKTRCISSEKKVSRSHPDFLNRSVYKIILDRYKNIDEKISVEAFNIIKEFILSKRGIPHKTDLIYQSALGLNLASDKLWKLAEITIKEYGVPVNPFVEAIVLDLIKNGHTEARITLKKWFLDKKYYQHFRFDRDSVSTIRGLLDTDFDLAIELFKNLISSDYIKNGTGDHFHSYGIAALLNEIIRRDYSKGVSIVHLLEKEEKLSKDQQIIYVFGLFNNHGNDESDGFELLSKIYLEVIDPFLEKYNNIEKISERLTVDGCREGLVQFGVRLATNKDIGNALRIIHIFVSDTDPYLPNQDPEDKENKYNEHQRIIEGKEPSSITSVRGWCGWALMKCSILAGREYIPEIIELAEKLGTDENYYVVHMATFALHQIALNRLTVLPDNRDVLFFNDNKEKALKLSRRVEDIAFSLLKRFSTWPELVQKAIGKSILHVFDPIRSLDEKRALELINIISNFPTEVIGEAAPLLLYYAEFRKDSYKKWRFSVPGLYDDLEYGKYDGKNFKKALDTLIIKIQKADPAQCFRFLSSLEHIMRETTGNERKKYATLFLEYCSKYFSDIYNHHIFLFIYQIINNEIRNKNSDKWYNLYIKCLKIESIFYKETLLHPENMKKKEYQGMYWWPSLYNSETLESIYNSGDIEKFIKAAQLVFSLPKEFELHESDSLIEIIKKLPKTRKEIKAIKRYLLEKSPSKYWGLK